MCHLYMGRFDEVIGYFFIIVLPSPQIAIGLLLISIVIVVTFDIKIELFKSKG